MKHQHLSLILLSLLVLLVGTGAKPSVKDWFSGPPTGLLPEENPFCHAEGQSIVDENGKPLLLRGVAFGNEVWGNPALPPEKHHGEIDYKRAADMGFNSIRFYLNYRIFEEDSAPYSYKETGFAWLDRNIVWAKKYKIRLILNMHVPQGGFQSLSEGDALWNTRSNQERLVALWTEIARRYADEPVILAYDLVNEPVVTKSLEQWRDLAAEITWNIRQVDPRHIIIVERMNANEGGGSNAWSPDQNGEMNFFLINDRNIVYEFHTYNPFAFTHQNAPWVPTLKGTQARWPDENRLESTGGSTWNGATFANPQIGSGTSDWKFFEGVPFTVTDPSQKIGHPALQGNGIGNGTVWYDDLTLTERDAKGKIVRSWQWDFSRNDGLYYWSDPVKGKGEWSPNEGIDGSPCWKITGSGANAVLSDGSSSIKLTVGHSYVMSGWMRGNKVPGTAQARIRLDLYVSPGGVYSWDKAYLAAEIDRYLAFGKRHNVPLYLGEFGCIADSFQDNRGGAQWVSDMLDICAEKGIHYNYHTWHEIYFGIWLNPSNELPAKPNQPLIDLFTRKQKR